MNFDNYIPQLKAKQILLWELACRFDDIDPSSKFICLSNDNPYTHSLNGVTIKLQKALENKSKKH